VPTFVLEQSTLAQKKNNIPPQSGNGAAVASVYRALVTTIDIYGCSR
jgi:hypothetical protein